LILLVALPLSAARDDFYLNLLHRGMAHVDAGQYDTAMRELHIAAFGLVDAIPQFEIAHIYITLAADHLKSEADARRSAQRVVAAERVDRRYGLLSIPASARRSFEEIASRLLTNDQYAFLRSSPANAAAVGAATPVATEPQPIAGAASQPSVTQPPAPPPRETTIVVPMPLPQPAPRITVQPAPPTPVPAPRTAPPPAQPQPRRAAPQPTVSTSQRNATRAQVSADAQLTLADSAIARDDTHDAARIYKLVLADPNLTHAQLLRIGEGAYRARDFVDSARALARSGFRGGEEPYRYYYAVALYETGDHAAAKRELRAALPHIELTREVARYRTLIEAAAP
jgi:hypothetical protein